MKLWNNFLNHSQKKKKKIKKIKISCKNQSSEFLVQYVHLLYYEYPKLKPIYSLQIETKNLDKNKKATINPVNRKGNKCFQ